MPRSNSRGGRKNNNPSGRNQYSDWGVMEMVRERPIAAAATAVSAAAAGLFLWSKRTQISEQVSELSDKFSEWAETMRANGAELSTSDDAEALTATPTPSGRGRKNQAQIAEEALTLKETGKTTA